MNTYVRLASTLLLLLVMAGCTSASQGASSARTVTPTSPITPTSSVPRDPCAPAVGPDLPLPKSYPAPAPASSQAQVLYGVAMVTADDGWAVGGIYRQDSPITALNALILHYTGGHWAAVSSPTRQAIRAVQMLSSSEGWAVGDGGVILHYQGGRWTLATIIRLPGASRLPILYSISMTSSSNGWVVGDEGITVHYSGGRWAIVNHPGFNVPGLYSISMVSSHEGWAVGGGFGGEGAIEHYHNGAWEDAGGQVDLLNASLPGLTSITMVSASEGWAVSFLDMWHYCQGKWKEVIPASRRPGLSSVAMTSANEGWAAGGELWHYTGGQWTQVKSPLPLYSARLLGKIPAPFHAGVLSSVSMVSPDEGWAVGESINVLAYEGTASLTLQGTGYLIMHYLNGSWSVYNG